METFVYKYYDKNNVLLYVGCSNNPKQRYKQHCKTKNWANEIYSTEIIPCETRQNALQLEEKLILSECPIHNKAGNDLNFYSLTLQDCTIPVWYGNYNHQTKAIFNARTFLSNIQGISVALQVKYKGFFYKTLLENYSECSKDVNIKRCKTIVLEDIKYISTYDMKRYFISKKIRRLPDYLGIKHYYPTLDILKNEFDIDFSEEQTNSHPGE